MGQVENIYNLSSPEVALQAIRSFEDNFRCMQKGKFCLSVNSATSALFMTALALGLSKGDTVLASPISWSQTYFPFAFLGCNFITIDYMKDYPAVDPEGIECSLKKDTSIKAVLIAAIYGITEGIAEIYSICRKYKIPLIIDAAQALHSTIHRCPIGSFGDLVIFSFSNYKDYGFGEGGALICNNELLNDRFHIISSHPLRIHPELHDLEHMIDNLDGFNFNFRIHPATAIFLISKLKEKPRQIIRDRVPKNCELLKPPLNLVPCQNNNNFFLIDMSKNMHLNEDSLPGYQIETIAYKSLTEIFEARHGKFFNWSDYSFAVRPASDLRNMLYWRNNLILIKKLKEK